MGLWIRILWSWICWSWIRWSWMLQAWILQARILWPGIWPWILPWRENTKYSNQVLRVIEGLDTPSKGENFYNKHKNYQSPCFPLYTSSILMPASPFIWLHTDNYVV